MLYIDSVMVNLVKRLNPRHGLTSQSANWYYERFLAPHVKRGVVAGLSENELRNAMQQAFSNSNRRDKTIGQLFGEYVDSMISNIGKC